MKKSYKDIAAEIVFLSKVLATTLELMERDGTEGQTARMYIRRDWSADICNQLVNRIRSLIARLRRL